MREGLSAQGRKEEGREAEKRQGNFLIEKKKGKRRGENRKFYVRTTTLAFSFESPAGAGDCPTPDRP
jgi:hypothetical protein